MPRSPREPEISEATGRRLAAVRLALGLQQEALAARLGVSRSALANWENGGRLADVLAMLRLRERYNVPLDYIYAGSMYGLPFDLAHEISRDRELNEERSPFGHEAHSALELHERTAKWADRAQRPRQKSKKPSDR